MKDESGVIQPVHTFSLVYEGASDLPENFDDILFEAGCDDSTIMTRDGLMILDFDREAPSFREALISAIEGVEGTSLPVKLVRVEPL